MRSWDSSEESHQANGTSKSRKLLFVINISLGKNRSDRLPVYQGEDTKIEVSKFCTRNRLKEKEIGPRILRQVEEQLKRYNEQTQVGIAIGFQSSQQSGSPKSNTSDSIDLKKQQQSSEITKMKVPSGKMFGSNEKIKSPASKIDLSNFYQKAPKASPWSGRPGSPTNSGETQGEPERAPYKKILKYSNPSGSVTGRSSPDRSRRTSRSKDRSSHNGKVSDAPSIRASDGSPGRAEYNGLLLKLGADINIIKEIFDKLDGDRDNMISRGKMNIQDFSMDLVETLMPALKMVESSRGPVTFAEFLSFVVSQEDHDQIKKAYLKGGIIDRQGLARNKGKKVTFLEKESKYK
jgi:hypothetical protein